MSDQSPQPVNIFATSDAVAKDADKAADGFQNFAAKLGVGPGRFCGTEENLISKGHYEFNLITRNRTQLEAAYRGSWIVGQVVDSVAEDMVRAAIEITTNEEAETVADFMVYLRRLQVWQSLCSTIKWARLYGGAVAVLQIEGQDLSTPLDISTVSRRQFRGLVVYDRWQIWPVLSELINSGPNIGLPAYYDVVLGSNLNDPGQLPGGGQSDRPNSQVRVHHSRCVRMEGLHLPFWQAITEMMWGESVLERMWDRLIAFDTASLATGSLINRANLRMVGVNGLREILAAGGAAQEALVKQFEYVREFQSNEGLTLLDKEDEYQTTSYSFAGLADVLIQFGQQVSGSAQIPLVRLFGQSPAGLNSNGESDIRQYYDSILQKQESTMRDPLERIIKVAWQSFTGKPCPDDLSFEFTPLWQMSALDKASIAKTNTDTILEAQSQGVIDTATALKELKQASGEHGLFTNITDEQIEEAENTEPPSPEDLGISTNTTGDPGEGPSTPEKQIAAHVNGNNQERKFDSGDARAVDFIRKHGDHYVVLSHEGKTLGKYSSKAEAEKRLRQIEYFKHQGDEKTGNEPREKIAHYLIGSQEDGDQAFIKSKVMARDSAWKRFKRWLFGDGNFKESDHPRAKNGKFAPGNTLGNHGNSEGHEPFSQTYKGHKIEVKGNKLFINGEEQEGNHTGVSTAVGKAKRLIDKKQKSKDKAPVNDPGIPGTMKEFYKGTLKSSSGKKVTSKKQALAIGYSEEGKDADYFSEPDEHDEQGDAAFIRSWLKSNGGIE